MNITEIASRRVNALPGIVQVYERRDQLQDHLVERGTSAVGREELRLLEAEIAAYEDRCDGEQESEIAAENAWLRAAEYDPRMSDPREW